MHIYICTHICLYVYIEMYTSTCIRIYLSIYLSVHLYMSTGMYIDIYVCVSIYIYICIYMYIYIYACICTCVLLPLAAARRRLWSSSRTPTCKAAAAPRAGKAPVHSFRNPSITQRVVLDCQYGIRAQKPYHIWFFGT